MSEPAPLGSLPDPRTPRLKPTAPPGRPVVFVADEQDAERVDLARYRQLVEDVLVARSVGGLVEVSVLFVDTDTITSLNAQFMGVDGPTDVLAFPIDEDAAEPGRWPDGGTPGPDREPGDLDDLPLLLGDLVISPVVAARNAPEHAGSLPDELALLVVHGLLHLLGFDHATDEERVAMQALERELLASCWGALARDPWA